MTEEGTPYEAGEGQAASGAVEHVHTYACVNDINFPDCVYGVSPWQQAWDAVDRREWGTEYEAGRGSEANWKSLAKTMHIRGWSDRDAGVAALTAERDRLRAAVAEARNEYESAESEIDRIAILCAEAGVSLADTHQVVEKVGRVVNAVAKAREHVEKGREALAAGGMDLRSWEQGVDTHLYDAWKALGGEA